MTNDERQEESPDAPLGESFDLDVWRADAPPAGFAESVLLRVVAEKRARVRRRVGVIAAIASLSAAAALAIVWSRGAVPLHGEAIASDRTEISIGERARVVLEPGAMIKWNGDDVEQPRGDVFYRVEPGARFRVHTPAGDVEVKGTCFGVRVRDMQKRDFKAGAIGAAATALAFIGVYEGRVAVSHAGQRVELGAGESTQTGTGALTKATLSAGQHDFDAKLAETSQPLEAANQSLVAQVGDYRRRLDALAEQKASLEAKLQTSEKQLEAARANGTAPLAKHEFDLEPSDWKALAAEGTVKARIPCFRKSGWEPSPDSLNKLGLAPSDAAPIKNAYTHSNDRVWSVIKPLCIAAIGNPEVVDRLGPNTCQHLLLDIERSKDNEATDRAMAFVGEVRAGERPMPGPNEPIHPVTKMFLAVTGEAKAFESELAQSFGPEEAHRLTYAEDMCMGHSTWGSGLRKGKK